MPRGTRALNEHSGARQAAVKTFSSVMREQSVVSICWCGSRYVRVPRLYVCWGNTAVCDAPHCRPDDPNVEPAPGILVEQKGMNWVSHSPQTPMQRFRDPDTHDDKAIMEKRRRYGSAIDAKVVARRNRVQALWNDGLHQLDIALALEVAPHKVNNDLVWLTRHGKIQRSRKNRRIR
jgi:hypothetical protein